MAAIGAEDLHDKDPLSNTTRKTLCFTLITHLIRQLNTTGEKAGDVTATALIGSLCSLSLPTRSLDSSRLFGEYDTTYCGYFSLLNGQHVCN